MKKFWKSSSSKKQAAQQSSSNGCQEVPTSPIQLDDNKINEMAAKVCYETVLVDGDATETWSHRMVRTLAKTAKKYNCFDELHDAVTSENAQSRCCPARNDKQPGTLGRSNMFALKLFRFPWLRFDMQVKSTAYCRFPADNRTRQVCLNPWHYRCVDLPRAPIPPIVVNKNLNYGVPPQRDDNLLQGELMMPEPGMSDDEAVAMFTIPNVTMKGDEIKCLYEQYFDPRDPLNDFPMPAPSDHQSNLAFGIDSRATAAGPSYSPPSPVPYQSLAFGVPMTPVKISHPTMSLSPSADTSGCFDSTVSSPASSSGAPSIFQPMHNGVAAELLFPNYRNVQEDHRVAEPTQPMECDFMEPKKEEPTPPEEPGERSFDVTPEAESPPNVVVVPNEPQSSSAELSEKMEEDEMFEDEKHLLDADMEDEDEADDEKSPRRERPTYADGRPITPIEPRPLFRSSPSELAELARNAATYECVEYEEQAKWLGLMYYEEGIQVGEVKDFDRHHCLIDGYTATENNATRFSIGFYTNPKRSAVTSAVRSMIGKGVRLYLLAGEVYIENICLVPVFVQSISANMKNGFQLNTVSKLPPFSTMKVFDMRLFAKQLAAAAEKTYNDVYSLSRMCTIRISFCKGWGEHYKRSTVLKSPVWLQAHLHNPLHWIDSVLTCMGAPPQLCSSRT